MEILLLGLFVCLLFETRAYLCSYGWPGIRYVDRAGLELKISAGLCLPSPRSEGASHHAQPFLVSWESSSWLVLRQDQLPPPQQRNRAASASPALLLFSWWLPVWLGWEGPPVWVLILLCWESWFFNGPFSICISFLENCLLIPSLFIDWVVWVLAVGFFFSQVLCVFQTLVCQVHSKQGISITL